MSDARLSVSGLWADGIALARAHQGAVIWVAASFIFLPQLAQALFRGAETAQNGLPGNPLLALIGALIAVYGQLAVSAILLGETNVGAALGKAFHLFPRALLTVLLVALMLLPVALVVVVAAALLGMGTDPAQLAKGSPRLLTAMVPFFVAAIWIGARLSILKPTLVAEGLGARASLRRAWDLTRGSSWPLVGFLLSYFAAVLAVTGVIGLAGGVATALLFGKSVAGKLIVSTVAAIAVTIFSVISEAAGVVAYRALTR